MRLKKFKLEVDTNNAAFEGVTPEYELARILVGLSEKLKHTPQGGFYKLTDDNGNSVGKAVWK